MVDRTRQIGGWIRQQRLNLFALLAITVAALLWWYGRSYYTATGVAKVYLPAHRLLKPSGAIGHMYGWIGTAIMLSNFLYYLRKRLRWMEKLGPVPAWLDFHVFSGLTGSTIIVFHSAFFFRNWVALTSLYSLLAVVATGIIGRYIYAQIPREIRASRHLTDHQLEETIRQELAASGKQTSHELQAELTRLRQRFADRPSNWKLVALLPVLFFHDLARPWRVHRLTKDLTGRERQAVGRHLTQALRLERKLLLLGGFRTLMPAWRTIHRMLAALMLGTMAFHVAVVTWVGY